MQSTVPELELPHHALRVERAEEWNRLFDPDVNLVIMHRELDSAFTEAMADSRWPARFILQGQSNDEETRSRAHWSKRLSFLEPALRDELVEDAFRLMEDFGRLGADSFRVSLAAVTGVMCPAFHADSYQYRLITTYRGPGTEWTPNDNVNWPEIYSEDLETRIHDEARVRSIPAGAVALMQGDGMESETSGIVHRSPAHDVDATPRIVLRMDAW